MFHPGYAGGEHHDDDVPRHRLRAADRLSRYPISGTQFESRLRVYPVTMTGVIAPLADYSVTGGDREATLGGLGDDHPVERVAVVPVQLTRQSRIRRIHHKFRRRHGVERLGPARQDARAPRADPSGS